jgi:flagellar L-ring protein FlgH
MSHNEGFIMGHSRLAPLSVFVACMACGPVDRIGLAPDLEPIQMSEEQTAMMTSGLPSQILPVAQPAPVARASLWSGDRGSLLGDQRAIERGDILTVVIEIDDSAEMSNSSARSRDASQDLAVPDFFGIPQLIDEVLPEGASMDPAVALQSASEFNGDGSVRRNEQLELRVAATIVDVLPNGVLQISGTQEVRVNFELRELIVTGFVRPADITRQNEVTYDKIASARISYGGRGQISDMQQPRYGQQAAEFILPF